DHEPFVLPGVVPQSLGSGHRVLESERQGRRPGQVLAQALDAQIIGRSTGQGHLHDLVLGTRLAQAPAEVPHLLDGAAPVLGQEDGLGLFELLFDLGYCLDLLRSRHALSLWIEKPPARDRGFHSEKGPTLAGLDVHLSLRAPTVSGRVLELQTEWYRRSGSPTNRDPTGNRVPSHNLPGHGSAGL